MSKNTPLPRRYPSTQGFRNFSRSVGNVITRPTPKYWTHRNPIQLSCQLFCFLHCTAIALPNNKTQSDTHTRPVPCGCDFQPYSDSLFTRLLQCSTLCIQIFTSLRLLWPATKDKKVFFFPSALPLTTASPARYIY